jgi:hypothetical protein
MDDVAESIRERLAAYLAAELAAGFPDLQVFGDWPTPGAALPEYALAVLVAGAPQVQMHPPVVWATTPHAAPAVTGDVLYSWGWIEVPLQLDAWVTYEARRSALAGAIRDALNRDPAASLGLAGAWPRLGRAPGLALTVAALEGAPADYRFHASPAAPEDATAAQAGEWRATWSGVARAPLVASESAPLIKQLTFRIATDGHDAEDTTVTAP